MTQIHVNQRLVEVDRHLPRDIIELDGAEVTLTLCRGVGRVNRTEGFGTPRLTTRSSNLMGWEMVPKSICCSTPSKKTCTRMLGGCLDIYMRFEVVRLVRLGRHYRIYVKSNFQDFPGARNLTYVVVFASEIEVLVSPNPVRAPFFSV